MPLVDQIFYFGLLITIIAGLSWGSFATMAIYRLPRNMPWIGDKPRCFMCKTPLRLIDYFSILSFFYMRGKCRYCKGKYEENIAYFFTELLITLFLVIAYIKFGMGDLFVLFNPIIVTIIILAIVDCEHKKIPAKILISLFIIAAIYRVFIDAGFYGLLYGTIVAALTAVGFRYIYFKLQGRSDIAADFTKWQHHDRFQGPGFDYVKLFAICGAFLGFSQLLYFTLINAAIIFIWQKTHPASLRIGAIISLMLLLFLLFFSKV